jgi:hypothetical protein
VSSAVFIALCAVLYHLTCDGPCTRLFAQGAAAAAPALPALAPAVPAPLGLVEQLRGKMQRKRETVAFLRGDCQNVQAVEAEIREVRR